MPLWRDDCEGVRSGGDGIGGRAVDEVFEVFSAGFAGVAEGEDSISKRIAEALFCRRIQLGMTP
jgi:hypothetical protein